LPAEAEVGDALRLDGRVSQHAYLGDGWRYGVAVGGQQYLVDDGTRFAPGDAVAVVIPPTALHLFPLATGGPPASPETKEVTS
jgi:hypothetical protein